MTMPGAHHPVDQVPVIGHDQQSLRIFIQPSRISDSDRILQIPDNILLFPDIFRTNNPGRLIHRQDDFFRIAFYYFFSDFYFLAIRNLHARNSPLSIHPHLAALDQPVGLSSGTDASVA